MNNMILNVEFLAGTDLNDALKEAKEKAIALNVALVCFDFNGKSFAISENSDIEEKVSMYVDGLHRENEK